MIRKDIEVERDAALRCMVFTSDAPIAYKQETCMMNVKNPIKSLSIPDKVMTFLEDYILSVRAEKNHRFWTPPE